VLPFKQRDIINDCGLSVVSASSERNCWMIKPNRPALGVYILSEELKLFLPPYID